MYDSLKIYIIIFFDMKECVIGLNMGVILAWACICYFGTGHVCYFNTTEIDTCVSVLNSGTIN